MNLSYAPDMGLNDGERFIVDFYTLTNRHMSYLDAVQLISDGYKRAIDFIRDCELYESALQHSYKDVDENSSTVIPEDDDMYNEEYIIDESEFLQ